MQASYGSYVHDDNELTLQMRETIESSQYGMPVKLVRMLSGTGRKLGSSALINDQIRRLQRAYSVDSKDFVFRDDNGVELWYTMRSADYFGGLHVVEPPHVPSAQGADLVTKAEYKFTLRGEINLVANTELFDLTETVQMAGGGPRRIIMETAEGEPVEQTVVRKTAFTARQIGSATAFSPTANIPPPRWPAQRIDDRTPEVVEFYDQQTKSKRYRLSWAYDFQSLQGFSR